MIIGQLIGGKIMMALDPAPLKFEIFQLHKSFGFVILGLSLLRLLWRMTYKPPALPSTMKPYERFAAKFSHVSFYVLMIGTPLAGWALVSASTARITTKIFKSLRVPDLPGIERGEAAAKFLANVHEYMAFGFILLLILHISAALKHHFIDRDRVLIHMLPWLKQKQPK